jgi:Ca2+-binding RTX toxin-like protein
MVRKIVIYSGPDTAGEGVRTIWETDGIAGDATQMAAVTGAYFGDVNPSYITAYDGITVFEGVDSSDKFGLWVSDGSAAGTVELGGIASAGIAGANPDGLAPNFMQVYNGKVLFEGEAGLAGNETPGLWVTDGSVAGTSELGGAFNAGITGVYSGGFLPDNPDFTLFNGKVLFSARDQFDMQGLWITDGTAGGTSELGPISGAAFNTLGSPSHPQLDIQPQFMAVLGTKVIFDGADQEDTEGSLWVSDGTANGTTEVGGEGNQAVAGAPFSDPAGDLPIGMQPQDVTTFSAINKVIFAAYDDTTNGGGHYVHTDALWVSDGTVGGTSEIGGLGNAGIIGANSAQNGGLFWEGSVEYPDFTEFNGKVLFAGYDSSGHIGLWETDGTATGTTEIGGLGNAGIAGFNGLPETSNPDFTVYNNEVLFEDISSNLWVTDGTVAGTHMLGSQGDNAYPPLGPDFTVTGVPTVTVSTASGVDTSWATIYNELANSPIAAGGSATQYIATDTGVFNGQGAAIKFVVTGSGFTYSGSSPNIQLTGGIINSLQVEDTSSNVLATFSGLVILAATFQAAISSYVAGGIAHPSPTALNNIFLARLYDGTGGAGNDKLQGGNLNDDFYASTGNDSVNGGAGINTIDYSALSSPGIVAIVQGGGGTVGKGGANGSDTLTGVQDIIDTGTGRSNGDVFYVDSAENVTAGTSFNYLIELSATVNLSYGTNFTGISEFVSNTGTNTVNFSADTGFAYIYGSTGKDTLTLGSGGGYLFSGGGTANVLTGAANATNLLVDSGGTSTMNGGGGTASNYFYVAGATSDTVAGAGAFDAVIQLTASVTVQLGSAKFLNVNEYVANSGTNVVSVASTDHGFKYIYGGAGSDTLSAGSGGGYLIGEGGTNVLTGGGGTNVFVADGASGVDTMNGGTGSNVYFIDSHSTVHGAGTFNTVVELQQGVSLTLGSAQLGTDVQEVVLNGGTNTADFHTAAGAVFLYGSSGNDTLFGGTGNDFLYGAAGTNTFEFGTGWGKDTIMDWTTGSGDQIDLTALSGSGVHAVTDLTQTITGGNDVITSSHTGTNSITLMGVGSTLSAGSFHFA